MPAAKDSQLSKASLNNLRLENTFDVQVGRHSSKTVLTSDPRSPGMASGVGIKGISANLVCYIIKQLSAAAPRI